jgi:hypothetical protein
MKCCLLELLRNIKFVFILENLKNETIKYHQPPFMEQILDRLESHSYYCFLDAYSGSKDQ